MLISNRDYRFNSASLQHQTPELCIRAVTSNEPPLDNVQESEEKIRRLACDCHLIFDASFFQSDQAKLCASVKAHHGDYVASLVAMAEIESILSIARSTQAPRAAPAPAGLRALLADQFLHQVIPATVTQWIDVLIRPDALNLRNILLHGFLGDALPVEYASLLVSLLAYIELHVVDQSSLIFHTKEDTSLYFVEEALYRLTKSGLPCLNTREDYELDRVLQITEASQWLPEQHKEPMRTAWNALYHHDDGILFAMIALPALEHTLHCLYASSNGTNDAIAQKNEYFVTLDGWGQSVQSRKHDLLLASQRLNGKVNRLMEILPSGVVALGRDFFLQHHGPQLRARITHRSIRHHESAIQCIRTLACLLVSLCAFRPSRQGSSTSSAYIMQSKQIVSSWKPLFTPARVLCTRLRDGWEAVHALSSDPTILHLHHMHEESKRIGITIRSASDSVIAAQFTDKQAAIQLLHGHDPEDLQAQLLSTLTRLQGADLGMLFVHQMILQSNPCSDGAETDFDSWETIAAEVAAADDVDAIDISGTKASLDCHIALAEETKMMLQAVKTALDELNELAKERAARTPQRRLLVRLLQARRPIATLAAFALCANEREGIKPERRNTPTPFLRKLHGCMRRVRAECDRRAIDRAVHSALAFVHTKSAREALQAGD